MRQLNATYKDIFRLSIPISVSLMLPQISFLANTLFVSRLGQLSLVALGMVGVYYLLLTWISYGLSNGLLVLLSRKAGENDRIGYSKVLSNGWLVAMVMMVLLMALTLLFGSYFYKSTLSDTQVINASSSFLKIRIWGLPFLMMGQIMNVILISNSKTKWIVVGAVISNVFNVGLDYLLIFGNWGFPNIGLKGAAIASIAGEFIYCVVMLFIIYKKNIIPFHQLFVKNHLDKSTIQSIGKISSPLILQYIFSIGGWQLFFIYIEHLGQYQLAATHIMRNALGIIGIGSWAFASTANTLVSNLLGQKKIAAVSIALRKMILTSGSYGVFISLILYFLGDPIISIFTENKEIASYLKIGFTILTFSGILMCMATVIFNAVVGIGNTKINMVIEITSVVSYIIYITIIVYYLNKGFMWAWSSEILYWLLLMLLSAIYFYKGSWKKSITQSSY